MGSSGKDYYEQYGVDEEIRLDRKKEEKRLKEKRDAERKEAIDLAIKWGWMMEYCKKRSLPPAMASIWTEAEMAYIEHISTENEK